MAPSEHVRRLKNGTPSVHPLRGDEVRALRRLRREQESGSIFVFLTERDAPMTAKGFHSTMRRLGGRKSLAETRPDHNLTTPDSSALN